MTGLPAALRWLGRFLAALVILSLVCAAAGVLVVRSGWFREKVRARIVAEVEQATGGRVEIGRFSFRWETLTATVAGFVLHGMEPESEPPLLRVESVRVGLRVISMMERKVDLSSLLIDKPRLRIVIYPDGSNNLPEPRGVRNGKDWAQNLVDLAIRRYAVTDGLAEVDVRKVPLNFSGEDLAVQMSRDPGVARYRGEVASRRLRIAADFMAPTETDMSAAFTLDATRLNLAPLRVTAGKSRVELNGDLTNLRMPRGTFRAKAELALADAVPMFSLPVKPAGAAAFDGELSVSFSGGFDYKLSGRTIAKGLSYTYDRLRLENATVSAAVTATPARVTLQDLQATALGAKITGQADLVHTEDAAHPDFHFQGKIDDLEVRQAAAILTDRQLPWNGMLAGTVEAHAVLGKPRTNATVSIAIAPMTEGVPVDGQIEMTYDQEKSILSFGDSRVSTPATSLIVAGAFDQSLTVRARTTNVDDVLTALSMAGDGAPKTLPLQFAKGGEATLAGTLTGRLTEPMFHGEIALANASVEGHAFDRLRGDIAASRGSVEIRRLTVSRGQTQIDGDVTVAAAGGDFTAGPLTAQLNARNVSLAEAARELGIATDARGTASAAVHLSGTARNPEAEITINAREVSANGEQAESLRGTLRYTDRSLAVTGGQADLGTGKVLFAGAFEHPVNDYKNGEARLDVTSQNVRFTRIAALQKLQPTADARLDGKAEVRARVQNGALQVRSIKGDASARGVTLDKEALGDVNLAAETSGNELALQAKAQVRGTPIEAQGKFRMDADMPGSLAFRFPRLTIAALHDLVMLRGTAEQKAEAPALDGYVEGSGTATLSLRTPENLQAEVKIDALQLNTKSPENLRLGVQSQDVQIRNSQPILIAINAREARIRAAHLTARDTDLEVSGAVPFQRNGGADLNVRGTVNLAALQLLNAELLARGRATVGVSIRGSVRDPLLNGRMEFTGASLYMTDVPSGLDNASGTILFDRNRATIETLTAETGGGQMAFKGFLEFGNTLIYRLQAEARQVRVRYPEDVSFTGNAQLALTGTSAASTLSGTVTLNRAAISPRVDLGRLLAQAAKPSPAPPNPNEYLRGMRFDVHVGNSPTFELETSLTRNVETEVDLHLRGTPLRPALQGSIAVNSGEIQVFGNRYAVNRGDIRFLSPVKIEPILDMNLETRTRGITVNVAISGSADRLNVNYSSDPPLQSREIIALLAVGRDPTALSNAAQFSSSTSGFSDAGGLLGQAVSQELSNRLQRFFGASRVKIDPTMTGIDNLPSARLTIEQQVSRDISLTYITNLNRTQEQIVRVQWDLNRQWSAVAIRNSNGLFGVDIQFRKRFK